MIANAVGRWLGRYQRWHQNVEFRDANLLVKGRISEPSEAATGPISRVGIDHRDGGQVQERKLEMVGGASKRKQLASTRSSPTYETVILHYMYISFPSLAVMP